MLDFLYKILPYSRRIVTEQMKAACLFVALFFVLGYLGYTIGTAAGSTFCEYEWCRFYIVMLCTGTFTATSFFLSRIGVIFVFKLILNCY